MNNMILLKNMKLQILKLALIAFAISFVSCIEDLNDEYVAGVFKPTITGSVLYFETTEALINAAGTNPALVQSANFDGFSAEAFSGRVISGSLSYELINTTSKQLNVLLELLDSSGNLLDSESFNLNPNTSTPISRETFYGTDGGRDIDIIKNLSEIRLTIINGSDFTSVSTSSAPKLIFKSKGAFKLQLIK